MALILIQDRNKYHNADLISKVESVRSGGQERTVLTFTTLEKINLEVKTEDFLDDLRKAFDTTKNFAIFVITRANPVAERVPTPRR